MSKATAIDFCALTKIYILFPRPKSSASDGISGMQDFPISVNVSPSLYDTEAMQDVDRIERN